MGYTGQGKMDVHIIYDSKYGNGKTAAEYLQQALKTRGHTASVQSVRQVKPSKLPGADLYVFASPTHFGRPTRRMKTFLKKLTGQQIDARYALMTTCLDQSTQALDKMDELLASSSMTRAADGLKVIVEGMKGPLKNGYRQDIERFAETLAG
jgi:flavorubredoxin